MASRLEYSEWFSSFKNCRCQILVDNYQSLLQRSKNDSFASPRPDNFGSSRKPREALLLRFALRPARFPYRRGRRGPWAWDGRRSMWAWAPSTSGVTTSRKRSVLWTRMIEARRGKWTIFLRFTVWTPRALRRRSRTPLPPSPLRDPSRSIQVSPPIPRHSSDRGFIRLKARFTLNLI